MIYMGKAHKFADNINTDNILSSKHRTHTTDYKELAQFLMEDISSGFYKKVVEGDFIVAGTHFGSGSSREYVPRVIKAGGIGAVIAKSYARIFFRNAFNIGLPLVECNTALIENGDFLKINFAKGIIKNQTQKTTFEITPLPIFMVSLLKENGLINFLKNNSFDSVE